jgi:hypothetical protein
MTFLTCALAVHETVVLWLFELADSQTLVYVFVSYLHE